MKRKIKFLLIPTLISTSPLFAIACTSDFDKNSDNNLANLQLQAKENLQQYNRYFNAINSFFENQNSQASQNFVFYYKDIQVKAQILTNALNQFNKMIQDASVNFNLKDQIKQTFFKELNLKENQIKSYSDAFFRFNAINEELGLIAEDRVFNSPKNIFLDFKKNLDFLANTKFAISPIYDEWFSNAKLNEAREEYKNKWYNSNLKSINYTQLQKRVQVDGNLIIEHTHAIGNVVKEWSVIVADQKNSSAFKEIKALIEFLNTNINQINDSRISSILNLINTSYQQYLDAVKLITNQFAGAYPSDTLIGFFDENSNFENLFKIWQKTNELYVILKG
ncbi:MULTISPECIES: MAG0770 family lipoprotein [unclassified Mycoplasma]|uniref:MAG0770 family lipoprotein n=1 Tax=unclassified Mycoplasma TaxID=2683645 RepID=UPI00211B98C1|nr:MULTISPECIES: hypothetical protein [unclassified Mycoplasma]UUM19511.1 hypothetical protein NPA11_01880 [Mycoplasma sp. 1578d]UUM25134.1 hypothetical protein NPA12_01855 [Mycoplasma sp. 3686d]